MLKELDGLPEVGAAVNSGEKPFDDGACLQLERTQAGDDRRIEKRPIARGRCHTLHAALRHRHGLEEAVDDRVRVDALRLGVEVGHDPVTQDRLGERLDVLD